MPLVKAKTSNTRVKNKTDNSDKEIAINVIDDDADKMTIKETFNSNNSMSVKELFDKLKNTKPISPLAFLKKKY